MTGLRRYSALVAALLLVTVAVQMLDMGYCCEARRAPSLQTETTALLVGGGDASGDLLVPGGQDDSSERAMQPDCLCHLTFTSSGAAPALQAVVVPLSTVSEVQASPHSTLLSPPGHIPIA